MIKVAAAKETDESKQCQLQCFVYEAIENQSKTTSTAIPEPMMSR
jgi:hypothetical protein